jgi:hypothetical protein
VAKARSRLISTHEPPTGLGSLTPTARCRSLFFPRGLASGFPSLAIDTRPGSTVDVIGEVDGRLINQRARGSPRSSGKVATLVISSVFAASNDKIHYRISRRVDRSPPAECVSDQRGEMNASGSTYAPSRSTSIATRTRNGVLSRTRIIPALFFQSFGEH